MAGGFRGRFAVWEKNPIKASFMFCEIKFNLYPYIILSTCFTAFLAIPLPDIHVYKCTFWISLDLLCMLCLTICFRTRTEKLMLWSGGGGLLIYRCTVGIVGILVLKDICCPPAVVLSHCLLRRKLIRCLSPWFYKLAPAAPSILFYLCLSTSFAPVASGWAAVSLASIFLLLFRQNRPRTLIVCNNKGTKSRILSLLSLLCEAFTNHIFIQGLRGGRRT